MIRTLKVFFEQGEIVCVYLFICSEDQAIKINLSPVFSPFNDILNFLENILNKREIKIEIDEEGKITKLQAKKFKKNTFHFVLIKDSLNKKPSILKGEYEIKNFVFEFIKKLNKFMAKDFDRKSWERYKVNIDYAKLKKIYNSLKK